MGTPRLRADAGAKNCRCTAAACHSLYLQNVSTHTPMLHALIISDLRRLVCPLRPNNDWSQRVATEQDNPEHPDELMAVREAVKFVQGALQALPLMALYEAGDTP